MTEIKEVHTRKDYQLEVILDNGSNIVLNMQPKLHTMRFGLLRNPEFFPVRRNGRQHDFLDQKVELSIREVFEILGKQKA